MTSCGRVTEARLTLLSKLPLCFLALAGLLLVSFHSCSDLHNLSLTLWPSCLNMYVQIGALVQVRTHTHTLTSVILWVTGSLYRCHMANAFADFCSFLLSSLRDRTKPICYAPIVMLLPLWPFNYTPCGILTCVCVCACTLVYVSPPACLCVGSV